jgi:uncharacterized membrane protein
MDVHLIKTLHVISATIFFGAGMMSAFWKLMGDRTGDPKVIAWCQRQIVLADWIFTVPCAIVSPATGLYLVVRFALPWRTPWVLWSTLFFVFAGLTWLPAVFLQKRMRAITARCVEDGTPLPEEFHRANRIWFALGIPSFTAALLVIWLMVTKYMG